MTASAGPLAAEIDAARDSLAQARRLLCQPSAGNLQLCCGLLGAARAAIEAIRSQAERTRLDRGVAAAVGLLHNEINVIAILLERAAAFHANLLRNMVAASSAPAPESAPCRPSRLLVEA